MRAAFQVLCGEADSFGHRKNPFFFVLLLELSASEAAPLKSRRFSSQDSGKKTDPGKSSADGRLRNYFAFIWADKS